MADERGINTYDIFKFGDQRIIENYIDGLVKELGKKGLFPSDFEKKVEEIYRNTLESKEDLTYLGCDITTVAPGDRIKVWNYSVLVAILNNCISPEKKKEILNELGKISGAMKNRERSYL